MATLAVGIVRSTVPHSRPVRVVRDPRRPVALALDDDLLVAGRQPRRAARAARRRVRPRLHRSAVQHGTSAGARDAARRADPGRLADRASAGAPLPDRDASARMSLRRLASTTSRPICARGSSEASDCSPSTARSTCTSTRARATTSRSLLDEVFGRACFLNELIWAYDYGASPRRRWPAKHDVILVYVKDPERYWFDDDEVDREPYMAPGLVTPEQRARGKRPTTCGGTRSCRQRRERTGYPTQKPEGVLRRIVAASSRPGRLVPGLLRRVGDARRGGAAAGPAVRAGRRVAGRDRVAGAG